MQNLVLTDGLDRTHSVPAGLVALTFRFLCFSLGPTSEYNPGINILDLKSQ